MKFHVNPETGDPGECSAKPGSCPYGADAPHYATKEDARAGFESAQNGSFTQSDYLNKALKLVPEVDYEGESADVEDNWGDVQEIEMGVLTDDARWLMMNGQCLGFARQLADVFGTNRIAVHHHTLTSEELAWDDETDEPALDEDGEEYFLEYENIHHAYAIAPDGTFWDAGGPAPVESIELMYRGKITEYDSDDAFSRYVGFMPEQNEEYARSLIRPVLLVEKNKAPRKFKAPLPKKLYHVTTRANLQKIQESGLEPLVGDRSKELGEGPKVFLFDSKQSVVDAFGGWLGDEFDKDEDLVLLSVPSGSITEPTPSFDDPLGSWEWSTNQKIDASAITLEPDKL